MKNLALPKAVLIIVLVFTSFASGEVFKMKQKFHVEVKDEDYTIQTLADIGIDEKTICLWSGDDFYAFLLDDVEAFLGGADLYSKAFAKSLKQQGGSKISVQARKFKPADGLKTKSYHLSYVLEGESVKQTAYFTKFGSKIHFVFLSMVEPQKYDECVKRADSIMQTLSKK